MKMLLALAAGALGYCYYCGREAKSRHPIKKEELTRWEGEGGNVAAVATPSPVVQPQSSLPADDRVMRH